MKKTSLFILAIFCLCTITQAQISKGTILLGGGISGGMYKSEADNVTSKNKGITVSPVIGFTVKENTVFGISGTYGHTSNNYTNPPSEQKTNLFGGGVFLRKYLSLGKSLYLFGEGGLNYNYEKNVQNLGQALQIVVKTQKVFFSIYPGVAYAVNKNIHLEMGINNVVYLSYAKTRNDNLGGNPSHSENSGFYFSSSISSAAPFSVGFRILLGK